MSKDKTIYLSIIEDDGNEKYHSSSTASDNKSPVIDKYLLDLAMIIPIQSFSAARIQHLKSDIEYLLTTNPNTLKQSLHQIVNNKEINIANSYIKYPFQSKLNKPMVYHLSNNVSSSSPGFLDSLHTPTSTSTIKTDMNGKAPLSITLIEINENVICLDFSQQDSYWNCIFHLIRLHSKGLMNNVSFSFPCRVSPILQNLQTNSNSFTFNCCQVSNDDCMCEFRGSCIKITSISPRNQLFSIDISQVQALMWSIDHDEFHPFIWQITCECERDVDDDFTLSDLTYTVKTDSNDEINSANINEATLISYSPTISNIQLFLEFSSSKLSCNNTSHKIYLQSINPNVDNIESIKTSYPISLSLPINLSVHTSLEFISDIYSAWWPARLLTGVHIGWLYCSYYSLLIQLNEKMIKASRYSRYTEYINGFMCIPWHQIVSAGHISKQSLIININLQPLATKEEPTHFNILVGPTYSHEMESFILEQKKVQAFKVKLLKLLSIPLDDISEGTQFLDSSVSLFSDLESVFVNSKQSCSSSASDLNNEQSMTSLNSSMFISLLRRKCCDVVDSGKLPPLLSSDAIQSLTLIDLADFDKDYPTILQDFISRMETIGHRASINLRKVLLCSSGTLTTDQLSLVATLLQTYFSAARRLIYETPQSGEEIKLDMMKLIIYSNHILEEYLLPILQLVGIRCNSSLSIVEPDEYLLLLRKYSDSLVRSIKSWLGRNLTLASKTKTISSLPWDYLTIGLLFVTVLPEDFQRQLNIFLDLHISIDLSRNDDAQLTRCKFQLLKLNECIISAAGESLQVLSDEYDTALKSQHWELPSGEDLLHNIRFLIACANDSLRIQTLHALTLQNIQTNSVSINEKIISKITKSFEKTRLDALKRIADVFYIDLHDCFKDFFQQWSTNIHQNLIATITETLNDYFSDFQVHFEVANYYTLLILCCQICCSCYLLFLKDRAVRMKTFSTEELLAVADDVEAIKSFFLSKSFSLRFLSDSSSSSLQLERTLKYIEDAVDLLTLNPLVKLQGAISAILASYPNEMSYVASNILKLVAVRPDFNPDMARILATEENALNYSDQNIDISEDLFIRIFSSTIETVENLNIKGKSPMKSGTRLKIFRTVAASLLKSPLERQSEDNQMWKMVGLGHTVRQISDSADDDSLQIPKLEDTCFINIQGIELRGLVSMSVIGLCNPYIVFTLDGIRKKTSILWNKKGIAAWEREIIKIKISRLKLLASSLHVEIFDKERIRRKREVGVVDVKLSGLEIRDLETWFAVISPVAKCCELKMSISMTD